MPISADDPAVQPSAANTLARLPAMRPVDTVKITPVPGISTTIRQVMKKFMLSMAFKRLVRMVDERSCHIRIA